MHFHFKRSSIQLKIGLLYEDKTSSVPIVPMFKQHVVECRESEAFKERYMQKSQKNRFVAALGNYKTIFQCSSALGYSLFKSECRLLETKTCYWNVAE